MTTIYIDMDSDSDWIKQRRREIENSEELSEEEKFDALIDLEEDEYEYYADLTEEQREQNAWEAELRFYEGY